MKKIITLFVIFAATSSIGYAAETTTIESTPSQAATTENSTGTQNVSAGAGYEKTIAVDAAPLDAVAVDAAAAVDAATALNPTTSIDDAPAIPPAPVVHDPLESFNRVMFTFNEKLDQYVVRPIATFYNTIMPRPLNEGIHNFYSNLGQLPTIANDILQLNFYQMVNDMWRFGINSTVGILGFFDVATRIDLKYYANDFGLTLAAYGWKNSTYLVLPFFGPNTIRDTVEIPVDYFAFSIYPYVTPESRRYELYGVGVLDRRAQLLQFQNVFEEAAVDRYIFMRNAYMQRRAHQIEQNQHLSYKDRRAAQEDQTTNETTAG